MAAVPCNPGSWSHSQISQRPFIGLTDLLPIVLSTSSVPSTVHEAEDIKMQKEGCKMLTVS